MSKLYGRTDEIVLHVHRGCTHKCRCAGPKSLKCQKCSRDRTNREFAARAKAAK